MDSQTKVEVPGFQKFLLPILQFAKDGQEHTIKETIIHIANIFQLSQDQRQLKNSKTGQLKFDNRINWAIFYLRKTKLLESNKPGTFRITELGIGELNKNLVEINLRYLRQFEGFPAKKGNLNENTTGTDEEEDEPTDIEIPGGTVIPETEWEANTNHAARTHLNWLRESFGDKLNYNFTLLVGRTGVPYYGCNVWLDGQPVEHFRNDKQEKLGVVVANFTPDDIQQLKQQLSLPSDAYELQSKIYFPNTSNYRFSVTARDIKLLQEITKGIIDRLEGEDIDPVTPVIESYIKPDFETINQKVKDSGLRLKGDLLLRYHLSLDIRGFVVLAGVSGTGKTWLAEAYASAIGAKHLLVPVAPNWTTNEDLLGYLNTLRTPSEYVHTEFSRFLRDAATEFEQATAKNLKPRPYHLILDEMNLARVEYYFAKFLSAMEVRSRQYGVDGTIKNNGSSAEISLGSNYSVPLTPNLYFIGTVNVDETTHGFADKVYDRAQLLVLEADRDILQDHLGDVPYRSLLLQIWDTVNEVAPFAFRVVDEIKTYIRLSQNSGRTWQAALDDQLVQKILPKLKGDGSKVGTALTELETLLKYQDGQFEQTLRKTRAMRERFVNYGFASYF